MVLTLEQTLLIQDLEPELKVYASPEERKEAWVTLLELMLVSEHVCQPGADGRLHTTTCNN